MVAENAFRQQGFDVMDKYVEKAWISDPFMLRGGAWRQK